MSPAPSERTPLRAVDRRRCALVATTIALCVHGLAAQQPDRPGFRVQQWRIQDGLPQATVTDIAIGVDGLLYVATFGGLCRFDGDRMQVHDTVSAPGLPSNRITTIDEGPAGQLTAGTQGHGVSRLTDGGWRPLDERQYGGVFKLARDVDGCLLLSSSRGLFREVDGQLQCIDRAAPPLVDFVTTDDGELLAASPFGMFRVLADGIQKVSDGGVAAFAKRGTDIVVAGDRGVGVLRDGRPLWLSLGLDAGVQRDVLCADNGDVWVAGEHGAAHLDADRFDRAVAGEDCLAVTDLGLPEDRAIALCEDAEGGVWVGFERHGLARLSRATLRIHAHPEGLAAERQVTVLEDEQGRLLATSRAGLAVRDGDRFVQKGRHRQLQLLLRDSRDRIWVAHQDQLCLLKHDKPVPFPLVNAPDQKRKLRAFSQLRTMVELPDGRLWVFGSRAIVEIADDGARLLRTFNDLRSGALLRAVAAEDGAVWLGGPNVLVRVAPEDQALRVWRCGEELPVGDVRAVLPEAGENAWIASYGGGLVRIEGDTCRAVDERHGLVDQSVSGLMPFGDALLVAGNRGCFLVTRNDVQDVADGTRETLACRMLTAEGDVVAECNGGQQQSVTVDARGHYWVCGVHGLYEFAPEWLQPRARELRPYVQQLVVGETTWPDPARAAPEPGARSMALRLGVNAFDDHERVRFRWRAPGFRDDWSAPSYDREIRLDQLPARQVTIEAEAIDVDGSTSPSPLRLSFAVPRRIWETTPFWVALPLLLASLVWLLVRAFSASERRRARHLQSVVDGRTRELVEARDRLEEHVAARTQDLREALDYSEQESERRRRLERELNDLRLSEAIGKLAGGVAHDFNNLLTVTLGSGELLEYEVESESALELVRNIVAASARGRSLTQHLLAVASRQVVRPEPMVLQDVLASLEPVLRPLLGEDTSLALDVPDEPAVVRGAVTQIEQILINLTANARDAIEGTGAVTIIIERNDESVALAVRDDGAGMTAEVREKAFEPFYTTKDAEGIGRGLGLATVFGIAKQLGGDVEIDSEVGVGTTVRVWMPRATGQPADEADASPPPDEVSGRVLLIEDQQAVRDVVQRQLTQLGCDVFSAPDGDAAIAMLGGDLRVDLVLSDVVMPGLQGAALVEALRAQVPGLPVVFMSGYMDGRRAHTDISELGFEVLAKPVEATQLARALARHLPSRRETNAAE